MKIENGNILGTITNKAVSTEAKFNNYLAAPGIDII